MLVLGQIVCVKTGKFFLSVWQGRASGIYGVIPQVIVFFLEMNE